MSKFVEIDGSVMEGGGQILRMATVFSALLHKPVHIHSIRAGRGVGGLRPQHMTGLRLVRDLCQGELKGDEVGSREIYFTPGSIKSGLFKADCGTAGSITLLIQLALPITIFAREKITLELKGGTDVSSSPPISHTTQVETIWYPVSNLQLALFEVLGPILSRFGVNFTYEVPRRGFYPKGGGEVHLSIEPIEHLKSVEILELSPMANFKGECWVAGVLPPKVGERMASAAIAGLQRKFSEVPMTIDTVKLSEREAYGTGCGINLIGYSTSQNLYGSSSLGSKGVAAEKVGEDAGVKLIKMIEDGGCVDEFIQDQLIVYMALAKGKSKIRTGPISLHTKTAIHIAELLTSAKFQIVPDVGRESMTSVVIECEGIDYTKA